MRVSGLTRKMVVFRTGYWTQIISNHYSFIYIYWCNRETEDAYPEKIIQDRTNSYRTHKQPPPRSGRIARFSVPFRTSCSLKMLPSVLQLQHFGPSEVYEGWIVGYNCLNGK